MKPILYLKLILGFVAFGTLCFVSVSAYTTHRAHDYVKKETANNLYREANLIASNYAANYGKHNLSLEDMRMQLSVVDTYLDAFVRIVNTQGMILLDSRSEIDLSNLRAIENFDIASFGNHYYQIGTFHESLPQESLTVFSPITIDYRVRGYVLIHKPLNQVLGLSEGFLNIAYQTLGVILIWAFAFLIMLTWTMYLPIRKLTKAYEENQRQFLANVSHDFRSPLTSIKGYVEAIMDGTIPHERQERYLNIILGETERLNKLTQGILELNKFGSPSVMLDLEPFDINNVIKMILPVFEGKCVPRKISFELIMTERTLFVHADRSKIQQVLYNLIDNAINFSPDDATITIETTQRNGKAYTSIKDQGAGIPKKSLKKIWERFYKTDSSRGKDKNGTGLGLAIVREIIQAHQETIDVASTEGAGSKFIFTLPLVK